MSIRKPLTPLMRDGLRTLAYSLIAPNTYAVIAGGFAADWTRAQDVDIWVMGDPLLSKTTEHFEDYGVRFRQRDEHRDSVPVDERERAVVVIDTPLLPIHVIGCVEQSLTELLRTFDISTHRWGLTRTGVVVAGEGATTPYEPGQVLTYRFPSSTDARVKKLKARYEIEIAPFVAPTATKKKAS